jgi:hypothetical protein
MGNNQQSEEIPYRMGKYLQSIHYKKISIQNI